MTDLAIRSCEIVIRRPAGSTAPWLDGDDHRALANRVQALVLPMLQELLAPRLAVRPPDCATPIRLELRLAEWELAGAAPLARPGLRARLSEAVETALVEAERRVLPVAAPAAAARPPGSLPHTQPSDATEADTPFAAFDAATFPENAVAPLLERLIDSPAAWAALSVLSDAALARLLAAALAPATPGAADATSPGPAADGSDSGVALSAPAHRRAALLEALATLRAAGGPAGCSAAEQPGLASARALARQALLAAEGTDRVDLPLTAIPSDSCAASVAANPADAAAAGAAEQNAPPPAPHELRTTATPASLTSPQAAATVLAPGRHVLDHALPFLALAVLARHGIADAMALDTGNAAACRVLAAAVGLKCLPPDSGRSGQLASTALAAGLAEPPDGAALLAAGGRLSAEEFCRASVAAELAGSLQPGPTLPLAAVRGDVVLFDPGGLYPLAAGAPAALAPLLRAVGRPLFLAPPDPKSWCALESTGLTVLAEGPPLREEVASSIAGPYGWRGHATTGVRLSAASRAGLPEEADRARRAAAVWEALDAPLSLLAPTQAADPRARVLNGLAALLAGFALADIGWALFRRDPSSWAEPDPLLVRDRFDDLSGWLEVDKRRLTVVLPLGRRSADLRDARLLDTVRAAPWCPGREIAFRGG